MEEISQSSAPPLDSLKLAHKITVVAGAEAHTLTLTDESGKADEGLSFSLVPRVKFKFTMGCTDSRGGNVTAFNIKCFLSAYFHCFQVHNRYLEIPACDINVHLLDQTKIVKNEGTWIMAYGCVYIRDDRFTSKEFYIGLRNFLLTKFKPYKVKWMNFTYPLTITLPPEEDPDKMMASIPITSRTAYNPEIPTLIIKGLNQWFAEQPGSLRMLLETLGVVRSFGFGDDGISIQYEDCYTALKSLCGCSLGRKMDVEGVQSVSIVDYVLTWKEEKRATNLPCCLHP
ncbi:unnamed protein product [Cuscuta epithymum]|uniref:Uncharacterized protein n=2 Tax=Cuscuta epithymum TaxID=186058 RepID=A0AAV0DI07_9ASTE|nr:unnamed protein product [Cuscuta epithymum]